MDAPLAQLLSAVLRLSFPSGSMVHGECKAPSTTKLAMVTYLCPACVQTTTAPTQKCKACVNASCFRTGGVKSAFVRPGCNIRSGDVGAFDISKFNWGQRPLELERAMCRVLGDALNPFSYCFRIEGVKSAPVRLGCNATSPSGDVGPIDLQLGRTDWFPSTVVLSSRRKRSPWIAREAVDAQICSGKYLRLPYSRRAPCRQRSLMRRGRTLSSQHPVDAQRRLRARSQIDYWGRRC